MRPDTSQAWETGATCIRVTPAETEAVIDLLEDECGEVEFGKVFK
jgi:hypothetical protein